MNTSAANIEAEKKKAEDQEAAAKPVNQARYINLYVQLPNETMSELVRDYLALFFDKSKFGKSKRDKEQEEMSRKAESELNLTLNPTSLLEKGGGLLKPAAGQEKQGHDSILSSNKSATADFLNILGATKSPYGNSAAQ